MSFIHDAKLEIINNEIENDCCKLAVLGGIIHSSGELSIKNKTFIMEIKTDLKELYPYVNSIMKSMYGENAEMELINDYKIDKTTYYKISFSKATTDQVLFDVGIMRRNEKGNNVFVDGIDEYLIKEECCKKAFVKGAFLGSTTSSIKISTDPTVKTNTGYHLEFVSHNESFLQDLQKLLFNFEINTRLVERKNKYVLYVKDAEKVSDILALVGASKSVLTLQNEIISRNLRNNVNRQVNCLSANINKTIDASLKQLKEIEYIIDTIGIESLDEDLQSVCLLRLANPEETLNDLVKLGELNLSKSGINHRFRKISKIYQNLINDNSNLNE